MEQGSTRRARRLVLLMGAAALGACGIAGRPAGLPTIGADARAGWAVLPLQNLSTTPSAGQHAAALVQTRLHQRGVTPLALLAHAPRPTLAALLDATDDTKAMRATARVAGHRYALGGSVHEWHYKGAPDREAVVGVTLRLEELNTGQVLWQASAARTGWGRASLTSVGERVIEGLLAEIVIEPAPTR